MFAQESVMDIQKEREAFEATSPFSIYMNKVERDGNKYTPIYYKDLDYAQILSFGWLAWQAATAQAVPEGFVLVPVKEIKTWYLDDSEGIYREDPEWLCDIPVGEVVEVEHRVSYELDQDPVFAAIQWDKENSDVGYYETFKSKVEAEKVAAHCKAMIEAQEPAND